MSILVCTVLNPGGGGRVVSSVAGKPNVIVVQKGAPPRKLVTALGPGPGNPRSPPPLQQSGFEKVS